MFPENVHNARLTLPLKPLYLFPLPPSVRQNDLHHQTAASVWGREGESPLLPTGGGRFQLSARLRMGREA